MASEAQSLGVYGWRIGPYLFDALANAVYGPAGLLNARRQVIDLLDVKPGSSVLEVGCGSGGITRLLVERGARVVAVDRAEAMLQRARQRAPQARFVVSDAAAFASDERFDRVLLAFFLHELESAHRVAALRAGRQALATDGRLVIADHAAPGSGPRATWWRRVVRSFEPPTALEVMAGALETELVAAGLVCEGKASLAGGRAQVLVCAAAQTARERSATGEHA
jgi:SAM-dependent methyltransferase